MAERWFAGIVLVACLALLLRLALPWRRRQQVDAWMHRVAARLRRGRRQPSDGEREAQAAITRARRSAMRETRRERESKPPRRLH